MFEPTEHEVDDDLHASMRLFQSARIGEVAAIQPKTPKHLLLVLDGSDQDSLSIAIARQLSARFGGPLDVLDGREDVKSNELAEEVIRGFDARALAKRAGESYEQILAAAGQAAYDLIVVPCPFGRDLEKVGEDSTGTVIDVLLARSSVPLLVTRRPHAVEEVPFTRVQLVLIGENEAAEDAAAWSIGLVKPGGRVELVLALEQEVLENVSRLIHEVDPNLEISSDQLSHALERSHIRLHRALQNAASEAGVHYDMHVQKGPQPSLTELPGYDDQALLVLALEREDHLSHGHVHDRIRHTSVPVLVVPRD